jgi:RNA polymerase sigma-32 factor
MTMTTTSHATDDSLQPYFRAMTAVPVLPAEAQRRLAVEYRRTHDPALARRLVSTNLRLVVKIVRECRPTSDNFADLIQEGNLGLMRAVERFDPDRNVKLSSYAGWWIRAYVMRFIMEQGQTIRLGTTRQSRRDFVAGRRPPAALSLNQPLRRAGGDADDSAGCCRQDVLRDDEDNQPDHLVEASELSAKFQAMLGAFTAAASRRDRQVIKRRWLKDQPATLAEVGRSLSLCGERVRQLENNLWDTFRKTAAAQLAA